MFSCWFCKKKRKSLENISNNSYDKMEVQNYNFSKIRERDPFTSKFNNSKKKKINSYPASPVKVSHDRGYFSDQRDQQVSLERRRMKSECPLGLETKDSLEMIPIKYKHNATVAFPCQVPLRSPLVKDSSSDKTESKFCVAEKPMEEYALPSTSKQKDSIVSDKHTLVMEDKPENRFNAHTKHTEKKTIVRFRPGSFVSAKPPGGLCKNMTLRPDISHTQLPNYGKRVVDVPLRPFRGSVTLKTADGKLLEPIGTDKLRSSIRVYRESEVRMSSAAESLQESATTVIPVRRSSMSRPSEARGSVEPKLFPSQSPEVYAVTTRGRSGSVLQSSVRSLASKSDKPLVNRKNIRYSMDTDVFSPETRRSVKQTVPNYVNMDKGGRPLLVSDVLNPITSIFITDLKDPVPKDPLTKPKESNKWVKPRINSEQRTQPVKSATLTPRAVYFQEQHLRSSGTNKRARPQSYQPRDSSSSYSSDEEEEDSDFQCAKYAKGKQHVYAVELPENILTDPKESKNKNPPFKKKGKSKETHVITNSNVNSCGLNCNVSKIHKSPLQEVATQNKNNVTPAEQLSEEDEDLQSYPSKEFMRAGSETTKSGSKLRWRIIIKRGDDK